MSKWIKVSQVNTTYAYFINNAKQMLMSGNKAGADALMNQAYADARLSDSEKAAIKAQYASILNTNRDLGNMSNLSANINVDQVANDLIASIAKKNGIDLTTLTDRDPKYNVLVSGIARMNPKDQKVVNFANNRLRQIVMDNWQKQKPQQ